MFKQTAKRDPADISSQSQADETRRGSILLLSVFVGAMVFAFLAFTVDLGLITVVKQELQTAADASALAAANELVPPLQQGSSAGGWVTVISLIKATNAAVTVAGENPSGYSDSTTLHPFYDIQFGNRTWNFTTSEWETTWGSGPYNTVRTTLHRTSGRNNALPLAFSPVIGHQHADITEQAVASLVPGVGFSSAGGGHAPVIPFAVDLDSWLALQGATGPDDWTWNESTGTITSGADGVPELKIFPAHPNETLPAGNRGTINIGAPNNSTADLRRQIRDGVNAGDLAYHGGSIDFSAGPIDFSGDPGLSASMKAELEDIKGEPRAMVLFTEVSGNGANATYTCVRFAGIRIMDVKLTGPMSHKRVIVQPASVFDSHVIAGPTDTTVPGTLYTKPRLTQ